MSPIDPAAGWPDINGVEYDAVLIGGDGDVPLNQAARDLTARTKELRNRQDQLDAETLALVSKTDVMLCCPEDFYEDSDGDDWTMAFERAGAYLEGRGGGILNCRAYVYTMRFLRLRMGVRVQGVGYGQRRGEDGTTLKAIAGIGQENFIFRDNNDIRSWGLFDLVIHGNAGTGATTYGLFLTRTAEGGEQSNETAMFSYVHRVMFREFDDDALKVDSAGNVGGISYNVRNLWLKDVSFRRCGGNGINAYRLTDSYIENVIISGNKRGAFLGRNLGNVYIDTVKGFYNGQGSAQAASFNFVDCQNLYLNLQAQEEFINGIRLVNNVGCFGWLVADANGYPERTAVTGVYLRNCTGLDLSIQADSFHAGDTVPFLQNRALEMRAATGEGFLNCNLRLFVRNNTVPITWSLDSSGVALTGTRITENGILRTFGTGTIWTHRALPTDAGLNYLSTSGVNSKHRYVISAPTGQHDVEFFTGGAAKLTGYAVVVGIGDGSANACHRLNAGGNLQVGVNGSGGWDAPHATMGAYHLWVDSTGRLRMKNGAPTSDTDGVVVGTQT
jgi:hypothetical protein